MLVDLVAMQAEAPRVLVQSMRVLVKAVLVLFVRPVNTMGDLVLLESLIEMEAVAMLVVVPKVVFVQVVTRGSDRSGGGGGVGERGGGGDKSVVAAQSNGDGGGSGGGGATFSLLAIKPVT